MPVRAFFDPFNMLLQQIIKLNDRVEKLDEKLNTKVEELRQEVNQGIQGLRQEVKQGIQALRQEMEQENQALRQEVHGINRWAISVIVAVTIGLGGVIASLLAILARLP